MPSSRDYALLGVVLGTVLLSGAVFAFPDGFYPEYHYEVEQVTMDDEGTVYGWATTAPEVYVCHEAEPSLTCSFERRVRDHGPVVRDDPVRGQYELVFFRNGTNAGAYYRANGTQLANGSYAHELDRIGPLEALSVASREADRLPHELRRVLDRGDVWTTTSLPGWDAWELSDYHVVEYEGRYYRQGGASYYGTRHRVERLVRWLVGLTGLAVLAVSIDRARQS